MKAALLLFMLTGSCVYAQETVAATGGEAHGDGGTVSYTIGQVAYTAHSAETGSVSQGVQQSYTIISGSGLEEDKIALISTFPNPTIDQLTLKIEEESLTDLSYRLYDLKGKLILQAPVVNTQTTIVMQDLESATYLLEVVNNSATIEQFKIIKH